MKDLFIGATEVGTPSFFWAFAHCPVDSFASLASAVPRAATARFRRAPAMILGPRHASLIAASRNLERFARRRERLVEYHILSVRLRIERPSNADCSAGPLSSESGQRAFERLEKSQISADTHKWGAFPIYIYIIWHLALSLMGTCRCLVCVLAPSWSRRRSVGTGPRILIPRGICEARACRTHVPW